MACQVESATLLKLKYSELYKSITRVSAPTMFTLSPASAKRIADSIRKEGEIVRLVVRASASIWAIVDGKVTTGREVMKLSSAPDTPGLNSLVRRICKAQPSILNNESSLQLKKLTRRERAFLLCVAREACELGLWFSVENPQTVIFHCGLYRVSIMYPELLVRYMLGRLDACVH
jgi:hypothetical protein